MNKEIIAWGIADESGILGSYEDTDTVVFYRTRQAAKKDNREVIKEFGYEVKKLIITWND